MKNIILVIACLQDNTVNKKITGREKSNKTKHNEEWVKTNIKQKGSSKDAFP